MDIDLPYLQQWIGKTETLHDRVNPQPVAAMIATLDRGDPLPKPGDPLPEFWHWLYFLPMARHTDIGPDGHPKRGGFLPPVPLPRRMWAGSRLEFVQPLRIDEVIERRSSVLDVQAKHGRSGTLVFVTVRHETHGPNGLAISEEQDIVYRDNPVPGEPAPTPVAAPDSAQLRRTITPDPVMLFRYSALTFNGHRIHYDRQYVTEVEGYPGLVFHGPLTATLLLDLVRRSLPGRPVRRFDFRGVRPLFDLHPFDVCGELDADGNSVRLWARDPDGFLASKATALLG